MERQREFGSVSLQRPPITVSWPAHSWTRANRRQVLTWLRKFIPETHGREQGVPPWWSPEDQETDSDVRELARRHLGELLLSRLKPGERLPLETDPTFRAYLRETAGAPHLRPPRWTHRDEARGLLSQIEDFVAKRMARTLRRHRIPIRLGFARETGTVERGQAAPFLLPSRSSLSLVTPETQVLRAILEEIDDVGRLVARDPLPRLRRVRLWGTCGYCGSPWISPRPRPRGTCERIDCMDRARKAESLARQKPPSSAPGRVKERVRRYRDKARATRAKGANR